MADNFHDNDFHESTIVKLDLYKKYLTSAMPAFIHTERRNGIVNIFDFFAGPGEDGSNNPGSPILAIEAAIKYYEILEKKNITVHFHFYDKSEIKIEQLKKNLIKYERYRLIKISCHPAEFPNSLLSNSETISNNTNILFMDQFGIKSINETVLKFITSYKRTDFIFFTASSAIKRFFNTPEFKSYMVFKEDEVKKCKMSDIHRLMCKYYQRILPENSDYILTPFSIKKERNIYGLIHGSQHLIGSLKFLEICWKIDPRTGEANFDIDDEALGKSQIPLFEDNTTKTKLEKFQQTLKGKITDGEFINDLEIFEYSIKNGFIPSAHAKPVLKSLKEEKKINYPDGTLRLGKTCINEPRRLIVL